MPSPDTCTAHSDAERLANPISASIRVIAATHRDLRDLCSKGSFRWDLFYRLSVAELNVPRLTDRGIEEVSETIDHFLSQKKKAFRRPRTLKLSTEARKAILEYPFPGNVRELENLIESLYVFCDDKVGLVELREQLRSAEGASFLLKDVERRHIEKTYHYFGENKQLTSRALGISLNTLKKRLREYDE